MKRYLIYVSLFLIFNATFLQGRAQTTGLVNDPDAKASLKDSLTDKYAKLLGVDKDSIKNVQLYTLIDQFAATPYKYGGNDIRGVDCSGLTYVIEKKVYGITIPRITDMQAAVIKPKAEKDLKEGDLVFFNYGGSKTINHVGIYLQNGYFIHATSNLGVVIQNLHEPDIYQSFVAGGVVANAVSLSSK